MKCSRKVSFFPTSEFVTVAPFRLPLRPLLILPFFRLFQFPRLPSDCSGLTLIGPNRSSSAGNFLQAFAPIHSVLEVEALYIFFEAPPCGLTRTLSMQNISFRPHFAFDPLNSIDFSSADGRGLGLINPYCFIGGWHLRFLKKKIFPLHSDCLGLNRRTTHSPPNWSRSRTLSHMSVPECVASHTLMTRLNVSNGYAYGYGNGMISAYLAFCLIVMEASSLATFIMSPSESDSFLTCAAFATISMHWIKARQDNVVDFMFLRCSKGFRTSYLNISLHEIKKSL